MKRVDVRISGIRGNVSDFSDIASQIQKPTGFCGVGVDLGRFAAKVHVQVGDQGWRDELPSRGRPAEEVVKSIAKSLAETVKDLGRLDFLAVAAELGAAELDSFVAGLGEALPSTLVEVAPRIDVRVAPWYAVRAGTAEPLWVLDVGWRETQLHQLTTEADGPLLSGSRVQSRLHGRLVDKGVLWTLHEFGIVADVERAYDEIDGPDFRMAEELKRRLSETQVVKAGPEATPIRAREFENDLFKQTDWKSFPDVLVDDFVRESMEREGGGLVLCGASCRLPWLAARLRAGLAHLREVPVPGGDPGYLRALGLACYAFDHLLATQMPESPEPEPIAVQTAVVGVEAMEPREAAEGEIAAADKSTPGPEFSVDELQLRLQGTLVPMFQDRINCAPVPYYLRRNGRSEIDVQCFAPAARIDVDCPRFLGRRTIEVPAGDPGFSLRFQLVSPRPLVLKVEVLTHDDQIFKEQTWNVEEE